MAKPTIKNDPTLPTIVLRLGGVDRHPRYDHNAIVQAEAATGINLLTAMVDDITATKLRGLLWASLLPDDPDLTLEDAGKLINPLNIGTIHSALLASWFGSLSDDEEPKAETPGKPRARRPAKS